MPLQRIAQTLDHFAPDLIETLDSMPDYRGKRATYSMSEIVLAGVTMFLFKEGSRNQLNEDREEDQFRRNYKTMFGLRLPHLDTVSDVMNKLDTDLLESCRRDVIKYLLDKRTLHKFCLLGKYFTIAIDGSGVYAFDKQPYAGCPSKTSKKGKTTWNQNVLEAKIVCSNGFRLSIATEWLKNEDGSLKQDCEQKALKRLVERLKRDFPRLPICILLDGLFAAGPVMEQLKSKGWEYIIVWKDGKLKNVQEQLNELRLEKQVERLKKEEIHNPKSKTQHIFEYSKAALTHQGHEFYYIKHELQTYQVGDTSVKDKKRFITISSISPNKANIKELTGAGRMRWKIENEGFNAQKNHGFNLYHKYVRKNFTGIRNFYMCIQIAHLIDQLFVLCKNKIMQGWKTLKGMWKKLLATILIVPLDSFPLPAKSKLNYRY
jgi:hypothetical protein